MIPECVETARPRPRPTAHCRARPAANDRRRSGTRMLDGKWRCAMTLEADCGDLLEKGAKHVPYRARLSVAAVAGCCLCFAVDAPAGAARPDESEDAPVLVGFAAGAAIARSAWVQEPARLCEPWWTDPLCHTIIRDYSTQPGIAASLHVGRKFLPRTALLFSIAGILPTHPLRESIEFTLALQQWTTPHGWVRAGVGVAGMSDPGYLTSGLVLELAVGAETAEKNRARTSLSLHCTTHGNPANGAGQVSLRFGVTWHVARR
jgi:hypothetical protein